MIASCTGNPAHLPPRSTAPDRWLFRCPTATGPDDVIRRVDSGAPMTVAELRRAAALLTDHVRSGRMDVVVARVRVAVRLEKLGA